mmetsp:Transcript_5295/g.13686  ORF Transcript_5295/g.13686 Transcript_5295/m.13686 type:complete len:223 (+) Transcript_5295:353-1021(+)
MCRPRSCQRQLRPRDSDAAAMLFQPGEPGVAASQWESPEVRGQHLCRAEPAGAVLLRWEQQAYLLCPSPRAGYEQGRGRGGVGRDTDHHRSGGRQPPLGWRQLPVRYMASAWARGRLCGAANGGMRPVHRRGQARRQLWFERHICHHPRQRCGGRRIRCRVYELHLCPPRGIRRGSARGRPAGGLARLPLCRCECRRCHARRHHQHSIERDRPLQVGSGLCG